MISQANSRVTRQPAVGRFRDARLGRRVDDMIVRQDAVLAASEQVTQLVIETCALLSALRENREAFARQLRAELSRGRMDLGAESAARLAGLTERRQAAAVEDRARRQAGHAELKRDVARIVSEDF